MTNKPTRSDILKKKLIKALEQSLGVVTTACKNVDVARSTFYDWYNADEVFKKEVDGIGDIAIDFAESQLHKQIQDGNSTSTIFYLKCKGKRRGYVERTEIVGVEGEPTAFKIEIIDRSKDTDK